MRPCAPNKHPNRNNSSQTTYAFRQCDGLCAPNLNTHTQTLAHIRRITEILEALNRVNWKIKQKPKFSGNHSTSVVWVCVCASLIYYGRNAAALCTVVLCASALSDGTRPAFLIFGRTRERARIHSLACTQENLIKCETDNFAKSLLCEPECSERFKAEETQVKWEHTRAWHSGSGFWVRAPSTKTILCNEIISYDFFLFINYYAGGQLSFVQHKSEATRMPIKRKTCVTSLSNFFPVEFTLVSDWWNEIASDWVGKEICAFA